MPAIPAAAPVGLTGALNGANFVLSFPTVSGYNYNVYSKDDLGTGNWTLQTMIAGDGSVKSWSEPATRVHRYYRLVIQ